MSQPCDTPGTARSKAAAAADAARTAREAAARVMARVAQKNGAASASAPAASPSPAARRPATATPAAAAKPSTASGLRAPAASAAVASTPRRAVTVSAPAPSPTAPLLFDGDAEEEGLLEAGLLEQSTEELIDEVHSGILSSPQKSAGRSAAPSPAPTPTPRAQAPPVAPAPQLASPSSARLQAPSARDSAPSSPAGSHVRNRSRPPSRSGFAAASDAVDAAESEPVASVVSSSPPAAVAAAESPVDTQVQVCVRVRPLNSLELSTGQVVAWQFTDSGFPDEIRGPPKPNVCTITQILAATPGATGSAKSSAAPLSFSFDQIFSPSHSNSDIFRSVGRKLISQVMGGYHATCFAYGQTSSGKTHTVHGRGHLDPGMIPLSVQGVFDHIERSDSREFVLRISYLELYNEVVNDLLNPLATNLSIRESAKTGIFVEGLKESVVVAPDQVFALLSAGEAQRHVGRTNYNDTSSRSHTIFQLTVESTLRPGVALPPGSSANAARAVRTAHLNLVDLAGSENAVKAGAARKAETSYINRSLLTLGQVIYKLSESSEAKKAGHAPSVGHVPFRDSKLTRLLQNSLSGKACVSVICAVSPSSGNVEETISTLKFANRARKIRGAPVANDSADSSTALIRKYREEIERLKLELEEWKNRHQESVVHAQGGQKAHNRGGSSAKAAPALNLDARRLPRLNKARRGAADGDEDQDAAGNSNSNSSGDDSEYGGHSEPEDEVREETVVAAPRPSASVAAAPAPARKAAPPSAATAQARQNENTLTAQIEQLTRLILTSSQVPRAGEAAPDVPAQAAPTVAPLVQQQQQQQPQQQLQSEDATANATAAPVVATSPAAGGRNSGSGIPRPSAQQPPSATPMSPPSASAVASRRSMNNLMELSSHSRSGSLSMSGGTSLLRPSLNAKRLSQLDFTPVAGADGVMQAAVFDLDTLPPGTHPALYPSSRAPLGSWSRPHLESQYMQLLQAYSSQAISLADQNEAAAEWAQWRANAANRQIAVQSRFKALAEPLLHQIRDHIAAQPPQRSPEPTPEGSPLSPQGSPFSPMSPEPLAVPGSAASPQQLLRESSRVLALLADLLASNSNSSSLTAADSASFAAGSASADGIDLRELQSLARSIETAAAATSPRALP